MGAYLLKTEPGEYSFERLEKEKRCVWSGVRNAQAAIALRSMKAGDWAFIYHTGNEKSVVGLAKVIKGAYPDPADPSLNDRGEPRWPVVEVEAVKRAKDPLTLGAMKADKRFKGFALITHSRLSVMAVPAAVERAIRGASGL